MTVKIAGMVKPTDVTVPVPPVGTQVSVPVPLLVNTPDALAGQTEVPTVNPDTVVAPAESVPVVEIFCAPKAGFTLAPFIEVAAAFTAVMMLPPVVAVEPMVGLG